jgi:hypothetical protein
MQDDYQEEEAGRLVMGKTALWIKVTLGRCAVDNSAQGFVQTKPQGMILKARLQLHAASHHWVLER